MQEIKYACILKYIVHAFKNLVSHYVFWEYVCFLHKFKNLELQYFYVTVALQFDYYFKGITLFLLFLCLSKIKLSYKINKTLN